MDLVQILTTTADGCSGLLPIVNLVKNLFNIIKILVPVILIIMGAIDLTKAVMASDDKEIKAATSKLIKRAIAAVAVFFIVTLVTVLMNLVSQSQQSGEGQGANFLSCWDASNVQ